MVPSCTAARSPTGSPPGSESGDGGFAFYDAQDPTHLYHDFSLDQVNGNLISASIDGGNTWCSSPGFAPCNVADQEWTPNLENLLDLTEDPRSHFLSPSTRGRSGSGTSGLVRRAFGLRID